jgi:hypothetical protein
MKITDINATWALDCVIDPLDLGTVSAGIPKLHAKYLEMLTTTKLQIRRTKSEYLDLKRIKTKYYSGKMTKEELAKYEWNQFQGAKPLKSEMEEFIKTDPDIIKLTDKSEYLEIMRDQLENIFKSIHGRSWEVKNIIEWTRFTSGG